jgi:hypothetical protein
VEAQEPGSSLAKEVAALKADLVRWVVYQVNEQGRVPEDSALAAEISSKIEAAVERALAARLDAPGNPLEASRKRANDANEALETLSSQSRDKFAALVEGLLQAESGINGLTRSLDAIEKRVGQLMAKLNLPPEPERSKTRLPVVSLSPETVISPPQETDRLGALMRHWWVRWLVAPVIALALVGAILYWIGVSPFAPKSAPPPQVIFSDAEQYQLEAAFTDLQNSLEDVQSTLLQSGVQDDQRLATATLDPTMRQELRTALGNVHPQLLTLNGLLRSSRGAQVLRASGAAHYFFALFTTNAPNAIIMARAARALQSASEHSANHDAQTNGGRVSPTAREVRVGASQLLDSVYALKRALSAPPVP